MKKVFLIIMFCSLITSCEDPDPLPSGIATNVSGKFTDFHKFPITNAKVKIGEYRFERNYTNGGVDVFQRWIDSTYTDSEGKYNLPFTTTGNGTSYKLVCENPEPYEEQTYMVFQGGERVNIDPLGKDFEYNSDNFYNLYPCDVYLNLKEVTDFPIYVDHLYTAHDYLIKIPNVDVYKLRIYIVKNWFSKSDLKLYNTIGRFNYKLESTDENELTEIHLTLSDSDFIK